MAWVYAYPSATQAQGTDGWQWWHTFRSMRGPVQMRLTDVTSGDYQWTTVTMVVGLRDAAGSLLSTTTIGKTWGVLPNFSQLTTISGTRSVQLGTSFNFQYWSPYSTANWSAALRWDPAIN